MKFDEGSGALSQNYRQRTARSMRIMNFGNEAAEEVMMGMDSYSQGGPQIL